MRLDLFDIFTGHCEETVCISTASMQFPHLRAAIYFTRKGIYHTTLYLSALEQLHIVLN